VFREIEGPILLSGGELRPGFSRNESFSILPELAQKISEVPMGGSVPRFQPDCVIQMAACPIWVAIGPRVDAEIHVRIGDARIGPQHAIPHRFEAAPPWIPGLGEDCAKIDAQFRVVRCTGDGFPEVARGCFVMALRAQVLREDLAHAPP
jgi:hypothetical protein